MPWMTILFWIAVVLLLDAGIGLLGEHRFHRVFPSLPIRTIALIEGLIALVLLAVYFVNQASAG